jgi:hypothetical protein
LYAQVVKRLLPWNWSSLESTASSVSSAHWTAMSSSSVLEMSQRAAAPRQVEPGGPQQQGMQSLNRFWTEPEADADESHA